MLSSLTVRYVITINFRVLHGHNLASAKYYLNSRANAWERSKYFDSPGMTWACHAPRCPSSCRQAVASELNILGPIPKIRKICKCLEGTEYKRTAPGRRNLLQLFYRHDLCDLPEAARSGGRLAPPPEHTLGRTHSSTREHHHRLHPHPLQQDKLHRLREATPRSDNKKRLQHPAASHTV